MTAHHEPEHDERAVLLDAESGTLDARIARYADAVMADVYDRVRELAARRARALPVYVWAPHPCGGWYVADAGWWTGAGRDPDLGYPP